MSVPRVVSHPNPSADSPTAYVLSSSTTAAGVLRLLVEPLHTRAVQTEPLWS